MSYSVDLNCVAPCNLPWVSINNKIIKICTLYCNRLSSLRPGVLWLLCQQLPLPWPSQASSYDLRLSRPQSHETSPAPTSTHQQVLLIRSAAHKRKGRHPLQLPALHAAVLSASGLSQHRWGSLRLAWCRPPLVPRSLHWSLLPGRTACLPVAAPLLPGPLHPPTSEKLLWGSVLFSCALFTSCWVWPAWLPHGSSVSPSCRLVLQGCQVSYTCLSSWLQVDGP